MYLDLKAQSWVHFQSTSKERVCPGKRETRAGGTVPVGQGWEGACRVGVGGGRGASGPGPPLAQRGLRSGPQPPLGRERPFLCSPFQEAGRVRP